MFRPHLNGHHQSLQQLESISAVYILTQVVIRPDDDRLMSKHGTFTFNKTA
jgi:hypothetical protein